MMPASGLVFAAGAGAGAAAGAGATAAGAGATAGACSVVLIESLAGGVETPSYGLGLAWAVSNGVLRSREAAAASAKRDIVIASPNLTLSALILHLQISSSLHPQRQQEKERTTAVTLCCFVRIRSGAQVGKFCQHDWRGRWKADIRRSPDTSQE